jgi:hypothetical protein
MRAIKLLRQKPFVVAFSILGFFAIFYVFYMAMCPISFDERRPKQSQFFLSFKGFTMVDTNLDRVIKLEADELTMRPKKYYVFAFKPFTEIVLKNSKITVSQKVKRSESGYSTESKPSLFPKIEPPKNLFDRNSTNVISGVHLYGFIWSIREGDDVFFMCSAKHAYLDAAKFEIDLEEFELYNHVSGKKIIAKKGRFDLETNTLKIATSLIKEAQGVRVEGKLICLDLNLNAFRPRMVDGGPTTQGRMQNANY